MVYVAVIQYHNVFFHVFGVEVKMSLTNDATFRVGLPDAVFQLNQSISRE